MNEQIDGSAEVATSGGKLAGLRKDPKGWLVLVIAIGAVITFFGAAAGGGFGLWGWQAGLSILPFTGLAALIALIIAIVGIILDRRKGRKTRWPLLGLGTVVTLGFPGVSGQLCDHHCHACRPSMTSPLILADPPAILGLCRLRADNWDNIPGADDSDMQGMNPRQRWATLHQDAYPDVRSVRIDEPVADVIEKARRLAEDRGWEIANIDPAAGHLEATATISLFRFQG